MNPRSRSLDRAGAALALALALAGTPAAAAPRGDAAPAPERVAEILRAHPLHRLDGGVPWWQETHFAATIGPIVDCQSMIWNDATGLSRSNGAWLAASGFGLVGNGPPALRSSWQPKHLLNSSPGRTYR